MLTQEFEHQLINGLQLIVSLLSLQSRAATTPEAANQLTIAARRVAALGRVHRRLHFLDNDESVELKQYLHHLCEDLSGLLFQEATGYAIVVEGAELRDTDRVSYSVGVYRQRADHQLGEICKRQRYQYDLQRRQQVIP